jgi:hypothetical protein
MRDGDMDEVKGEQEGMSTGKEMYKSQLWKRAVLIFSPVHYLSLRRNVVALPSGTPVSLCRRVILSAAFHARPLALHLARHTITCSFTSACCLPPNPSPYASIRTLSRRLLNPKSIPTQIHKQPP